MKSLGFSSVLVLSILVGSGSARAEEVPMHMFCGKSEDGGLLPSLDGRKGVKCQLVPPNVTSSCMKSDGTPLAAEKVLAIFLPKQNSSTPVEVEVEVNTIDNASGWQLDFADGISCTIQDETQK